MGISNNDAFVIALAAMLSLPGLYALYKGMHKDLEETNLRLQLESYANEIKRLQIKVDEQQRKINDLSLDVVNMRSTHRVLIENLKRLATQVKQRGDEPVVDVDALTQMLS